MLKNGMMETVVMDGSIYIKFDDLLASLYALCDTLTRVSEHDPYVNIQTRGLIDFSTSLERVHEEYKKRLLTS